MEVWAPANADAAKWPAEWLGIVVISKSL